MNERLDRTKALPTVPVRLAPPQQRKPGFQPGKATVPDKRSVDQTFPIEPQRPLPPARPSLSLSDRWRRLRSGRGWTVTGAMVLLVSWGLWASDSGGDIASEAFSLGLIFLVALGLFAISRLVGGVVLEKMLKRNRRGAILSHMAIGLFLTTVGVKLLTQVSWVISAVNYMRGVR